ncbi:primosomal protein N' [Oscillibacter sp. MSJ-2]|uniref:Replication restart protein PriA n=1 Tax=Dysosmobacter acutus TaxID=2841504 RepID=A0ABS6FAG0_9FIRM|nr:primosomal protein N' [Dysosmobacter acutus]MBU5627270.1 primosomal protein N' [Dysosmobacter acutus]
METANIAKLAVAAAPYAIDKPYDYLIPEGMEVSVGVRVSVPFGRGNRRSEGVVLAVGEGEKLPGLKQILSVLDRESVLDRQDIDLALWMRQRYFCTLYDALKTILPAGLWYQFREVCRLAPGIDRTAACADAQEAPACAEVMRLLFAKGGSVELSELKSACGEECVNALKTLAGKGLIFCESRAQRKIGDKTRRMVELALSAEEAMEIAESRRRAAPVRYEAIRLLCTVGRICASELCYFTGASSQTLRALEKAGVVRFFQEETLRVPEIKQSGEAAPIVLNEEQEAAYCGLLSLMESGRAEAALLHGVTGSGKTQVYIRLVQEALRRGKNAIVLVPEIILTPQMMDKFSSCFGVEVAMLHSGLRLSERYDQWKRIRRQEVRVVLGTRSAIFAPLRNLGLIVMDEEQESSYQSENPPRYHTRDVAKFRCAQDGALLLLGSATPSVESAHWAREGVYHPFFLRRRYNEKSLPRVMLADLKDEVRSGNSGVISSLLRREIEQNLQRREQSILFLNRRGNSRMLLCGECGFVPECPRCSTALTYHSANGRLMCHYCGHSEKANEACPMCGGIMKRVGVGTQKVEEELRTLFPGIQLLRMDADTASGEHEALLSRFEREKIPILLGTQMVAKGLDFENVTLVGVLAADLSLYVDNYHAAERTFSLLTQVVGRAGRGEKSGRAVIQTYTPGNEVIVSAAEQDYDRFFESEIRMRRIRRYPPFADLFTCTISGTDETAVLRAAVRLREELRLEAQKEPFCRSDPEVLGPAPAPVVKVDNRYRYRILWVGKNDKDTRALLSYTLKKFASDRQNRGISIFVDCNALE